MVDVAKIIGNAIDAYRADWRKVIAPFLVLFIISLIFGVLVFLLRLPGPFCRSLESQSVYAALLLCYFPEVAQAVLGLAEELVSYLVIFAALIPLWELSKGKRVTDWSAHIGEQLPNALKVILFRVGLNVFIALPLAFFIALNMGVIVAAVQSGSGLAGILALGSIGMLIAVVLFVAVLMVVVNFLLTFLEVGMAVGGLGLFASINASIRAVMANLVDVFLFNLVWWLIRMAVAAVGLIMCCTVVLIPLMIILNPLIVRPVEWTSKIMLWDEISCGKKEGKAVKKKKKR